MFTCITCVVALSSILAAFYCDAQQVPAVYIFGDSLIDPGNNKYLLTTAQADFLPNGIDFEGGKATGRFCNGFTVVDLIVQELGLPLIPAYHDPLTRGSLILKGVSYASGGARILSESDNLLQNVEPLGKQFENFVRTRSQLVELFGGQEAAALQHLSKSIFYFSLGSNDYLHYMNSSRSKTLLDSGEREWQGHICIHKTTLIYTQLTGSYSVMPNHHPTWIRCVDYTCQQTPQEFQDQIVSAYQGYLTRAYDLGARKVGVSGIGPLGCIPNKRVDNFLGANGGACDEESDNLALGVNKALRQMVQDLNQQLKDLKMVFGNTYDLFYDAVNNPSKYGFVNANSACCGVSPLRVFACLPAGSVCSDRSKYLFWDAFHPTEEANKILAKALLDGDTSVMYPVNIRQLARL